MRLAAAGAGGRLQRCRPMLKGAGRDFMRDHLSVHMCKCLWGCCDQAFCMVVGLPSIKQPGDTCLAHKT